MWKGRQELPGQEDRATFRKQKSRNRECVCEVLGKDVLPSSIPLFPFRKDEPIWVTRIPVGEKEFGCVELSRSHLQ